MNPKRHVIPIFVPHYGCQNACVFCNQRQISGEMQPATGDKITALLMDAMTKIPEEKSIQIAFYGGSFTAIAVQAQEELLNAALPFLSLKSGGSLRLSTRPDCIDADVVKRLQKFGVKTVELGAQSMSDDVLKRSGRGHTAADTIHAAKLLKKEGFELILQMMTGLPGDTTERTMDTARQICALEPDGVRIYPTVVIRDTHLYEMWKSGMYQEHSIQEAVKLCASLLEIFEHADIPVIRLGLNPSEELSGGAVVAGAYHPAFGQLVYSEIYLQKARELLLGIWPNSDVILGVGNQYVSCMVGQKKRNILQLTKEFTLNSLKIKGINLEKNKIVRLDIANWP